MDNEQINEISDFLCTLDRIREMIKSTKQQVEGNFENMHKAIKNANLH